MNQFEKLYKKDLHHIKRWEKNYSDEEFYKINRKIRAELKILLNERKSLTSREKFICAIIYHHGFTIPCSKKALKYIQEAQLEGYSKMKWVKGAIIDRMLQLQNKPQKYGTQIIKLKNGKYKQHKLDGTISDKERMALGLPKLKDLKKSLEKN